MDREIPGFYYDPEKKRYFRIEGNQTAPSEAAWSASSVKRKRVETEEAGGKQRLRELTKDLIKRSPLQADSLIGGLVSRTIGKASPDMYGASWARELTDKGQVPPVTGARRLKSPSIQLMYIDGSDTRTGLGVAYYNLMDEPNLCAHYIPTDKDTVINLRDDFYLQHQPFDIREDIFWLRSMSSIAYHAPTHKMIITSRAPMSEAGGVIVFSPQLSEPEENRPAWLVGKCDSCLKLWTPHGCGRQFINTCISAPAASSRLTCVLATNKGILGLDHDDRFTRITKQDNCYSSSARELAAVGDILSLDFQPDNHNVLVAGGRDGTFWQIDLRMASHQWEHRRGNSAIAHVKALNGHQVLTAGVKSTMAIYDVRFAKKPKEWPLVKFPEYKNSAHLDLGLDVQRSAGHGVVAAAHDDGKVAVYSLYSGKRLKAGDVDKISEDRPIKSMMFQTMPREKEPSLFVGVGPYLQKYSIGSNEEIV